MPVGIEGADIVPKKDSIETRPLSDAKGCPWDTDERDRLHARAPGGNHLNRKPRLAQFLFGRFTGVEFHFPFFVASRAVAPQFEHAKFRDPAGKFHGNEGFA